MPDIRVWTPTIHSVVVARLKGFAGLTALLTSPYAYEGAAPQGAVLPYVTVQTSDVQPLMSQDQRVYQVSCMVVVMGVQLGQAHPFAIQAQIMAALSGYVAVGSDYVLHLTYDGEPKYHARTEDVDHSNAGVRFRCVLSVGN